MKLRCLLIDDEPPALSVLEMHISNIGNLEIVGRCKNALEGLEILNNRVVDLMFLDIRMPKILGTDFLKQLSNPPKVIITTAYRDYALDGFELDVVDYLLKPVSFERFLKAVTKARKMIGIESEAEVTGNQKNIQAFIYVKVDKHMHKVFVNTIFYIESCKDYVKFFLDDGQKIMAKHSIATISNLLSDYQFLRVHRSFIVCLNKISGYSNASVQLKNKTIPIGRLYKRQVLEAIAAK